MTTQFNFDTHEYKIPLKRWQTSFVSAISDFTYAYNSHSSLAIVYYGGHGYLKETGSVELTG